MKEGFIHTSFGILTKIYWHKWKTTYAVLTRNGTLYLLKSMYDTPTDAEMRYDLTSGGVHINGDMKSFSIAITSQFNKEIRYLRLQSMEDFAFWLRSLGEFGSKGTAGNHARDKAIQKAGPQPVAQVERAPIEDRQGTKTDELSAMYGI
jgi:hypothetical protein